MEHSSHKNLRKTSLMLEGQKANRNGLTPNRKPNERHSRQARDRHPLDADTNDIFKHNASTPAFAGRQAGPDRKVQGLP